MKVAELDDEGQTAYTREQLAQILDELAAEAEWREEEEVLACIERVRQFMEEVGWD